MLRQNGMFYNNIAAIMMQDSKSISLRWFRFERERERETDAYKLDETAHWVAYGLVLVLRTINWIRIAPVMRAAHS